MQSVQERFFPCPLIYRICCGGRSLRSPASWLINTLTGIGSPYVKPWNVEFTFSEIYNCSIALMHLII